MEKFFDRPDFGKLFIRLFLGLFFAWCGVRLIGGHGVPFVDFEKAFTFLHITLPSEVWIFLISIVYLVAGILFMAGSFFRSCSGSLAIVELVLTRQSSFAHPHQLDLILLHAVLATVCIGFLFMNPGRYSANP